MAFNYVYSNFVERLYEHLKSGLFSKNPFARRLIIVPSPAMKSWLMMRLADDPEIGIAAGIEVTYLDQGVQRLLKDEKGKNPSRCQLSLAIECELDHLLATYEHLTESEQTLWQQPFGYLHSKGLKRKISFSDMLADLFVQYGVYGKRMLQRWLQSPFIHWQQQLWVLLEKRFENWKYPVRLLGEGKVFDYPPDYLQVHVFGMSFIPSIHHEFLMRLTRTATISYYLLSPCQAFWSDLLSDKQRIYLKQREKRKGTSEDQLQPLDELLRDTNPLLANFGRLGREMAKALEEGTSEGFADYEELEDPQSMLQHVQSDLLNLRNPDDEPPKEFLRNDRSIQVHSASSCHREVEIVYHLLLQAIESSRQSADPIRPEDILIMAPDVMEYVPFIKGVFGDSESLLNYQIMDVQMPAGDPTVEAYVQLLKLAIKRWSASDILELLDSASFCQKQRFGDKEVARIRRWVAASQVQWGVDAQHLDACLQEDHAEKGTHYQGQTWQQAGKWLVEKWISPSPLDGDDSAHLQNVDGELLGRWLDLVQSLRRDLLALNRHSQKSLKEWTLYLQCLLESYFSVHDSDGYKILQDSLKEFARASNTLPDASFPFESILKRLEGILSREKVSYKETQLHAVRFCSLLPMRAIPAKVIVWMGMQEGAYPRTDQLNSLNLLKNNPEADYSPSKTDFDRYLFLETLLSARQVFAMTYRGQSSESPAGVPPSLIVVELLDYVDRCYEGKPSAVIHQKHPMDAFDVRYFQNEGLANYSKRHYQMAKQMSGMESTAHAFIRGEFIEESSQSKEANSVCEAVQMVVDLKELQSFASNPLRTYFKALSMTLLEDDKEKDAFELSALDKSKYLQSIVKNSMAQVVHQTDRQGKWPVGIFKELALENLEETLQKRLEFNQSRGWDQQPPTQRWILTQNCRHLKQVDSDTWHFPPLTWEVHGQKRILTGVIEGVTDQGLLQERKLEKATLVKGLPLLLAYCACIEREELSNPKMVLFQRDGKSLAFTEIDAHGKLVELVELFINSKQIPFLMAPELVDEFLEHSLAEFADCVKQRMEDPFREFYNRYLAWSFPYGEIHVCPQQHEFAKRKAKALLGDVFDLMDQAKPKRERKK